MNKVASSLEILFYADQPEIVNAWIEYLRDEGLDFTPVFRKPGQGPTGARVAVVWMPPAEIFDKETNLDVIFNVGAGVDAILASGVLPDNVTLVRLEGTGMGAKMAEYVIHALAEVTRNLGQFREAQKQQSWAPTPHVYVEDWPVGILGLGVIGSQVAANIAALGYPVLGWSRRQRHFDGVESYAGTDGFHKFLSRSRVLVNVLPLTPETRHILNRDTFQQLLPGGHVINIGRGEHLNEDDLLACVNDGTLAGATLDVFQTEPLPQDHPFWAHPAINVTPHISGTTNARLGMRQIATKLRAWRAGTPFTGIVDRRAGY